MGDCYFYLYITTLPNVNVRWYLILLRTGLGDLRAQAAGIGGLFQPCRYQERVQGQGGGPINPESSFCDPPKKIELRAEKKTYQSTRRSTLGKEPNNPCRTESTLKRSTKTPPPWTVWKEKRTKKSRKKWVNKIK